MSLGNYCRKYDGKALGSAVLWVLAWPFLVVGLGLSFLMLCLVWPVVPFVAWDSFCKQFGKS